MEAGNELTATPTDLHRDDKLDAEVQVGAATYVAAAIFNVVAMPGNLPDHIKVKLASMTEQAQRAAQEEGFVRAHNDGLLDGKTKEQRQQEKDSEFYRTGQRGLSTG